MKFRISFIFCRALSPSWFIRPFPMVLALAVLLAKTSLLAQAGITNLGLTAPGEFIEPEFQLQGDRLVFLMYEFRHGNTDLNGDGDALDLVVHVFDATTDTTTNLGLALGGGPKFHLQQGGLVAFAVGETLQGNTDLNGDGDHADSVLHLFDPTTATTTNLGLAARLGYQLQGDLLAFTVNESSQDNTDLNGDGDIFDRVLHLYNATTATTTNLDLAAHIGLQLQGDLLAFIVEESSQDNTDLNGDGDIFDRVLHLYNATTDTTTNLDLAAGSLQLQGDRLAFIVEESSQDNTDLNGDGDIFDRVLHLYNATTDTTTNLDLATLERGDTNLQLQGDRLAFLVEESSQDNTDLNSDGDASDVVLHLYNATTDTTTNLDLATPIFPSVRQLPPFQLQGDLLAFFVKESDQDNTDLNSDGDASDVVLHLYNATTDTTTNLRLALSSSRGSNLQLQGDLLAFLVKESEQDNTDLNSDGDADDLVVHLYNATTDTTTNLRLATPSFGLVQPRLQLQGDRLAFLVAESDQDNTDLNGDGDAFDNVLHVFDATTDTTTNLGLGSKADLNPFFFHLQGDRLAFIVTESAQGNTDLNGDGDTGGGGEDSVLHLADLSVIIPEVVDSASAGPNESVNVSTAPDSAGKAGVAATLTNDSTGNPTVTAANFASNPSTVNVIDVGGGYVDLKVEGADAGDVVDAFFYYPSTITGATETNLELLYFDGSAWLPVLSSGGSAPIKDTTDDLDGTVSGGRFDVTFDTTSTPKLTDLTGTFFTFTVPGVEVEIEFINGNSINLNSNKKIKIAVYSTDTFDALDIDFDTVELGDPQLAGTASPTGSKTKDVDHDGLKDMIYDFRVSHLVNAGAIDSDTTELRLTAATDGGVAIFGTTPVTVK